MSKIKKVFLFYPPGVLYQRGEDRSQGNITNSTATSMRAPNDMAYISAQLKKKNIEVFFIDYASENKTYKDLEIDFLKFNPDLACISTTTSTIKFDIKIINDLKKISEKTKFVIKGSLFFSAPLDLLTTLDLGKIDYLVGGEIEFALSPLINKSLTI